MREKAVMLEEVLYLTPEDEDGPAGGTVTTDLPEPTNPPQMIPGIDAAGNHFPIEKIKAHVEGVHHLALSVFVFAGDELLIQRRALAKYHCGGLWANTCCTHPHLDEDLLSAAHRRMREELGFTVPMEEKLIVEYSANVGNGLWERERVHMFRADVLKDKIAPQPNPDEVCGYRWISAEELQAEIEKRPETFTPWFRIYVKRFPALDF